MLPLAELAALSRSCAPAVAPLTLMSVAVAESGADPLAIGVNRPVRRALHPTTFAEAHRQAQDLLNAGADIDLGLMQINGRNLTRLGLTAAGALDPCRNLAGGARILTDAFVATAQAVGGGQAALRIALSIYNTGDTARGVRNGYVARVYRTAAQVVPAITPVAPWAAPRDKGVEDAAPVQLAPAAPSSVEPRLDVFAPGPRPADVWANPAGIRDPQPPPPATANPGASS